MKKLFIFFIMVCYIVLNLSAQQNNMVRINGGTFTIGSPSNEEGRARDEVQRQVTINSFSICKYEVTQKEYQEVMGINPSIFKGDNLPVENITWFDAVEYCNRRSQREGLTPVYSITGRTPASGYPITNATVTVNWNNNGYRLPTEAEWEYACRAGTTTAFNVGEEIKTSQANYKGVSYYNSNEETEYREKTTPVGIFSANAWGLYDMHGNVSEWCWDMYGSYGIGAQNNPRGTADGNYRVIRGGSWYFIDLFVRSAIRGNSNPSYHTDGIGFRVARL